jgi:hypothetical protein
MKRWTPVLVGILLTGCITIPIPTGAYRRDRASRRPISDECVHSLQPGSATRVDVLLSLGAPEVSLEAEAYFLYQWTTESGIGPAADSWYTSQHDLLFEFDAAGSLVRSGDLKTLLEDGLGRDRPPGPGAPSTIPILNPRRGKDGRLVLNRNGLRLEFSGKKGQDFTIPPGSALVLDYRTSLGSWTDGAWRRYDLDFRDASGEVHEVGIRIKAASLIPLARYLHQHSPEIQISD